MSLRVLSPGTFSLLVDGGRPRTRGLGIPIGGPADAASLMLGNALVGNPPFAPALEIALSGPVLTADCDVGMCVFGAAFHMERDGALISSNHTFTLRAGQMLRIGGASRGCRAYLCVPGGFRAKSILGSATAFEPVKPGDRLDCAESTLPGRSPDDKEIVLPGQTLRCLVGPQADWFDESFFANSYRVTPASNRMGIRLDGPRLIMPKRELVSEPVAPGAVQITNEGKPIVLGVDGQTIGGYPKIAHVISSDLDLLGQLRPGDELRFQRVSEKSAESAASKHRTTLRHRLRRVAIAIMS